MKKIILLLIIITITLILIGCSKYQVIEKLVLSLAVYIKYIILNFIKWCYQQSLLLFKGKWELLK